MSGTVGHAYNPRTLKVEAHYKSEASLGCVMRPHLEKN